MRSVLLLTVVSLSIFAACTSEPDGLPKDNASEQHPAELVAQGGATPAAAGPAANPRLLAPLPDETPIQGRRISSPRQVPGVGPFYAKAPSVNANERHASPVTGKDCMTCHGAGGPAPHFAFGGTIALGSNWVTGTPPWSTGNGNGNGNEYDDYGGGNDYDDYGGGGGGYGSNSDYDYSSSYSGGGSSEYGSDYGGGGGYDDEYGSDDDDGYGGGGGGGRRGWPSDRTAPSAFTELRIVGSDGYIFDTVTDVDGNFWFKAKVDVAVPAYTGLKYGEFLVTGSTNGIACASCHESGAADSPGRLWTWPGKTPR